MKIHEITIKKYDGTLQDLAKDIADLRYDALAELMYNLSMNISVDSIKDAQRGRNKLSEKLNNASSSIVETMQHFMEAWDICKKYMCKV